MSIFVYNDSQLQMDSRLILCIEEQDNENINSPVDTRLFIGWDCVNNNYYIRGRRQDTKSSDYVPYSFRFKSMMEVYNFVEFVMGTKDTTHIILYNYNNMTSLDCEEVTYDFFQENLDKNYEIAGYNDMQLKREPILKLLLLLTSQLQINQK